VLAVFQTSKVPIPACLIFGTSSEDHAVEPKAGTGSRAGDRVSFHEGAVIVWTSSGADEGEGDQIPQTAPQCGSYRPHFAEPMTSIVRNRT